MKPYGIPKLNHQCVEFPDKGDIAEYGLQSSKGRLKSKTKKATRRYFKRKARQEGKDSCID